MPAGATALPTHRRTACPIPRQSTVAELVVDFLIARGVDRVFGLQGGHIQPIWDQLARARRAHRRRARRRRGRAHGARARGADGRRGHRDGDRRPGRHQLRDRDGQRAARARARAADRRLRAARAGRPGSAAGHRARRHHAARHARRRARCASPTTCCATSTRRTRRPPATAIRPGPPMSRFRPTCCARRCRRSSCCRSGSRRSRRARIPPDADDVGRAAADHRPGEAAAGAHRPRRAARRAPSSCASSTAPARVYLDTQESRDLVPADHPSVVGAMRGARDAGGRPRDRRRPQARLPDRLRLAGGAAARALHPHRATTGRSCARTGAARSSCSPHPALALAALAAAVPGPSPHLDTAWTKSLRDEHVRRVDQVRRRARQRAGRQGRPHASEPDLRGAARRR